MRAFFKEYWLWIVIPFVTVLTGVWWVTSRDSGDGASAPFEYELFGG